MHDIANSAKETSHAGIGRRLEAVRHLFGLNQTAFAERLGFPRRTYLSWEKGGITPSAAFLERLVEEFQVDPIWLLSGPGDRPRYHGSTIDWDRMHRLHTIIHDMMIDLKRKPTAAQTSILVKGLYEVFPSEEADAIRRLREVLGTTG